jgi:hypothetical protein
MSSHIIPKTFQVDVYRLNPSPEIKMILRNSSKIFYGALTCWWSDHLFYSQSGLPVDPRGGVLFETDRVLDFLRTAEDNPGHYGSHKFEAFKAAFHGVIEIRIADGRFLPTCFRTWDQYNKVLDVLKPGEFGPVDFTA